MALSAKQRAFVNEYLIDYNATRAAERAGYGGNANTLAVTGYHLLRNPKIAELISQRLSETAMGPEEVMMRLGDQARGDIKDFLVVSDNGDVALNITAATDKTHLIKRVTQRRVTRTTEKAEIEEVTLTLELHDAQAALVQIGKHHKLFVEQHEVVVTDMLINLDR